MDRYAIFVDAGYLMAQSLHIVGGRAGASRSHLRVVDSAALINRLVALAEQAFGHRRLLRTYWYDGVGDSMTAEQTSIAVLPDVQFRAGTIHNKKQKGVDSRIVHDLFELASNRAIADAMVVTGDGDLAVGIEFVQRRGMRVALLSVEDVPNGVSPNRHPELSYLADRQLTLGRNDITQLFRYAPLPAATPAPRTAHAAAESAASASAEPPVLIEDRLRAVVSELMSELPAATITHSLNAAGGIVGEIDRQLLAKARAALGGRQLETQERNLLRKLFASATAPPA